MQRYLISTPIKVGRPGRIFGPGDGPVALSAAEVRAARQYITEYPESEAPAPAGVAPGAAGEAGERATRSSDATGPGAQSTAEGLVNINTATAAEIAAAAHGIGEATARDVIKHRKASGPFASLDDLTRVGGIGKATVERNRHRLTVG